MVNGPITTALLAMKRSCLAKCCKICRNAVEYSSPHSNKPKRRVSRLLGRTTEEINRFTLIWTIQDDAQKRLERFQMKKRERKKVNP